MIPAIELTRFRKMHGGRTTVDSLDLRIEPGTVFELAVRSEALRLYGEPSHPEADERHA